MDDAERFEKFREFIHGTYLCCQIVRSSNPAKQEKIERMRELAEELKRLFDEVVEGGEDDG